MRAVDAFVEGGPDPKAIIDDGEGEEGKRQETYILDRRKKRIIHKAAGESYKRRSEGQRLCLPFEVFPPVYSYLVPSLFSTPPLLCYCSVYDSPVPSFHNPTQRHLNSTQLNTTQLFSPLQFSVSATVPPQDCLEPQNRNLHLPALLSTKRTALAGLHLLFTSPVLERCGLVLYHIHIEQSNSSAPHPQSPTSVQGAVQLFKCSPPAS